MTLVVNITSRKWHSPKNVTPSFGRLCPSSKASTSRRRHRGRDVDQCHRPCCHPNPKVLKAFFLGCLGFRIQKSALERHRAMSQSKPRLKPGTPGLIHTQKPRNLIQDTQKPEIPKTPRRNPLSPAKRSVSVEKHKTLCGPRDLWRSATRTLPFCSAPAPGPSRCDALRKAACPLGLLGARIELRILGCRVSGDRSSAHSDLHPVLGFGFRFWGFRV